MEQPLLVALTASDGITTTIDNDCKENGGSVILIFSRLD